MKLTNEYRNEVEHIAATSWGSITVVVHRELFNLAEQRCIIALSDKRELLGYCYYRFSEDECEIMAIEAIRQNSGVGTALINVVKEYASKKGCHRVFLQTTNDNTHAIRYYQRHGFSICAFRLNEIDYSRKLKPAIPFYGEDNIPILHEIEFEMIL